MKQDLEQPSSDEPTEFELHLMDAARSERPSPELSARMARGLGLPVTGAGFVELRAGKSSLVSGKLGSLVGYVVGAGLLGLALFGSGLLAQKPGGGHSTPTAARPAQISEPRPSSPEPASIASAAALSAAPASAAPVSAAPVSAAPVSAPSEPSAAARIASAPAPRASSAPSVAHGDLREEIRLIDAARGAVAARSYEQALALLRRYSSTYPSGMFGQEASVLRLEALDRSGQHARAQALARDFLVRHPSSPLAERAERVAAY